MYSESSIEKFWAKVDRSGGPDACWPWTRSGLPSGYGQAWVDGKLRYSHRVAFEVTKGPIPLGHFVRHQCDNPPCCNPAHLLNGEPVENVHDMMRRGRDRRPVFHGAGHPRSLFTDAEVAAIRARYDAGGTSIPKLAAELRVGKSTIGYIVQGKTWAHLK